MTKNKPSKQVSFSARLDSNGLTASAKSRFISAVDRLLGSAVDIPANYLGNLASRIAVKGNSAKELLEAEGRAAIEHLTGDPNLGKAIAAEFTKSSLRKLTNKAKVVEASLEYLSNDQAEIEDTKEEVDQDWLNSFDNYAANASSDDLRHIWARVLAGEIRKPRSFSRSTLRFVAELDQSTAAAFQKVTSVVYNKEWLVRPQKIEGEFLEQLQLLVEVGLVLHVDSVITSALEPNEDGKIAIREQGIALEVQTKVPLNVRVINLTRTGREIMQILPQPNPLNVLTSVFEAVEKQAETAQLRRVSWSEGDQFRLGDVIGTLKRAPT